MNYESMYMNSNNLKELSVKLNDKIIGIEKCYKDIQKIIKEIDGSTDTWKGNNQILFYEYYSSLCESFPSNIEKLNAYKKFLDDAITNYENRDKDINKDIDINASNFDV